MKKLLIIAGIILVAAGGFVAWQQLSSNNTQTASLNPNTQTKTESTSQSSSNKQSTANKTPSSTSTSSTGGQYVDYSATVVANTSGRKVLFFHAPWCPQCRALDASIKDGSIPGGVTIIKTDYDSNQDLRQKYGVTIQTTLVEVDDNGNFVKKYVAYDDPTLDAVKANLL